MKKYFIILFIIAGFTTYVTAQSNCVKVLEEAGKAFEEGDIQDIPQKLMDCMESGFTRAQKIEAYKLIIMSYLFDDSQYEAETTMLEFLRKYPEYQIMPNDPVEFVYLFESYRTASVLSLSAFIGPTFSNPAIKESYSAFDLNSTDLKNKTGNGFSFGFGISREIATNTKIHLDAVYTTHKYTFIEEVTTVLEDENIASSKVSFKENLQRISFPLSLSYEMRIGNLEYFVKAGASLELLSDAKASVEKVNQYTSSNITGNDIDLNDFRNQITSSLVVGTGAKIKVPRGFIVLEARYHKGLINLSEKETITRHTLAPDYNYIDDVFSLDYVSVSLGYVYSIYQSKKKRF